MDPRTSAAIDMSLDEVIKSTRKKTDRRVRSASGPKPHPSSRKDERQGGTQRRTETRRDERLGSARRVIGNGSSRSDLRIQVDARRVGSQLAYATSDNIPNSSLTVSNLHHQVSEHDLLELFGTVGKVLKVKLEYDRSGRSNGTALVLFAGRTDAIAAAERFHNIPLDGLPMRIAVGEVPRRRPDGEQSDADRAGRWRHDMFDADRQRHVAGLGQRRGGRDDRQGEGGKSAVSAERLDDELESYMMQRE